MKRTILRASLWGILTLSLFYSCRTDSAATEQTVASKEKIAAFERFEKQNNIVQPIAGTNQAKTSQKYISYAKPFAEIITNFMRNHPDYAKWMDDSVGVIQLDVASQTFGDDKKAIIFPVTDGNGKVKAAWYGIINEERSYVNFSYMNDNSAELADIKKVFQNYYDKKKGSLSSGAIASISKQINLVALKNGNEQKPIDIEEVVITKKNPTTPPPDQWVPKYPDEPSGGGGAGAGSSMSGGSGTHSGGSTSQPADINYDKLKDFPCAYALAQQLPNMQNDIAKLLKDTFGTSDKVNVTFVPKTDAEIDGRDGRILSNTGNADRFDSVIGLNEDLLRNSTQEYLIATMYHEVIHSYMSYEWNKLGSTAYKEKYPYLEAYDITSVDGKTVAKFRFLDAAHRDMGAFLAPLENAILSFNPSFPKNRARALAMGGIFELDGEATAINAFEKNIKSGGAKGTKCTK